MYTQALSNAPAEAGRPEDAALAARFQARIDAEERDRAQRLDAGRPIAAP